MEIENGKITHIRCVRLSDGVHKELAITLAENDDFLSYNKWKREDPEYDEWLLNNKNKKVTIAPMIIKKPNVNSDEVIELTDKLEEKKTIQSEVKSDEPVKRQIKQNKKNV
jgi:hypothetical protein